MFYNLFVVTVASVEVRLSKSVHYFSMYGVRSAYIFQQRPMISKVDSVTVLYCT